MSSLFRFTLDLFSLDLAAWASSHQTITLAREYHPNRWIDATAIALFHFSFIFVSIFSFIFSRFFSRFFSWIFPIALLSALIPSYASAEPSVHVRARSVLSHEIELDGERLNVRLADEFGRSISDRTIALEAGDRILGRAMTDRLGRAAFSLKQKERPRDAEESTPLRLRFGGDASYDPALLTLERLEPIAAVELIPSLDRSARLFIDEEAALPLRVHARSSVGSGGLTISARDEQGALIDEADTDALGRASLQIKQTPAMSPGENTIRIESGGDASRSPAAVLFSITLYERTKVELHSVTLRRGEPIIVEGALSAPDGAPIDAALIALERGMEPLEQTHTGEEGVFKFQLEPFGDDTRFLAALRFDGDEARGLAPAPVVEIDEAPPRFDAERLGAALLVLSPLLLIGLGFYVRARTLQKIAEDGGDERATFDELALPRASPVFGRALPSLRIVDARSGEPVEGVRVRRGEEILARSGRDGRTTRLPRGLRGRVHLILEREDYIDEPLELSLPYRGPAILEISVHRLRDAPSRALIELARSRGKGPDELRSASHREIAIAIAREGEDLEALVEAIDRLYYGAEPAPPYEALSLRARIEALASTGEGNAGKHSRRD